MFFYLISFNGYSEEVDQLDVSPLEFNQIIQKIESLKNKDLMTAIKLSVFYDKTLSQYKLDEQIHFKKLYAELLNNKTDYVLANKLTNQGLELTKMLAHPSIVMAELLNLRGFAIENIGDYENALQDYMAALEIAESLNDCKVVIQALINLGAIYYATEKFQHSLIILNDALSLAQVLNNNKMLGLVYLELGSLYTYFKLDNKVKEYYNKAHKYFAQVGNPYLTLTSLQNIAITYAKNNEVFQAMKLYKKIIMEARKMGNFVVLVNTYSKMAEAYLKKSHMDPHTAYHYILIAEKYLKFVENPSVESVFLVNKADVLSHLKRYGEALKVIAYLEKTLSKQVDSIKTYSSLELLRIKSEIYYAQGLFADAYKTQQLSYEKTLKINARNNMQSLEGLRIEYESMQHELKAETLEKKQLVQSLELKEVNKTHRNRTFYIIMGVITVLGLAWFYVINLNNQKKLLSSRETNHLTDLPNRQTIFSAGSVEFNQVSKNQNEYNILIINVDNFTNINQVKGYDTGNSILIEISLIIVKSISSYAQCGRYSGNEFIVLLPNTKVQVAEAIANKIHNDIYKKTWEKYGLKVVSVSIGLSNNRTYQTKSYEALIREANTLKQQAVISGGNALCI